MAKARLILAAALFLLPHLAGANTDLDRKYALESVGILRAWDNIDGLFADYVSDAYKDYFSRQSRFVLQDISKSDPILAQSKIPYAKLLEDPDVLGQLARATRSQTLIRTKVDKEGRQYRFDIDWLHMPDLDVMAHEGFVMDEPTDGHGFAAEELKAKLEQSLDHLIRSVPFVGAVTGRDNNSVTLNIGTSSGLEKGDTLQVATLDEVKRHPLLKQIVEWRFANVGKVEIVQADDRIAFGKVVEEEPGHEILRQQKITEIHHPAPITAPPIKTEPAVEPEREEPPHIGWVSGGVQLGNFSRTYSSLDNSVGKDGSGFAYGFKVDSQLWITREWFAEAKLNYAYWSYSQGDTASGASSTSQSKGSGNLTGIGIAGGYSYLLQNDLLGPKGWFKLGYHSNSFTLSSSTADALAPITFRSFFVGLGGDLPVNNGYGAFVDFNLGVLNSVAEDGNLSGTVKSTSDVEFSIGGYYRFTQRVSVRVTVDFISNSADFNYTSATSNTTRTISQKVITFTPAVQYYF